MRLIDADAFDKDLLGAEIEATKSRKYVFRSAINTIRGNLANFPTVNQWIPCSERPPKKLEDVLLQFSHNMGVGFLDDDGWSVNTGDGIYSEVGKDEENPIAWMPLPKQYGGEQE